MIRSLCLTGLLLSSVVDAGESRLDGIVDLRATSTSSITSYLNAGYGKFANNDGNALSLAQLGLTYDYTWQSGISSHLVVNAFDDDNKFKAGLTEAYFKYRSLVNEAGYRWQSKLGIFYPDISLENDAIAWASKYTLNSSMINTWIAEEVRALGSEISVTRVGRFNQASYDLSFSLTAFVNNDPTGSLISWHGWTQSSRQTLWTETRKLPNIIALRSGNVLSEQARNSDPFVEVDSRIGLYGRAEIKFHQKGEMSVGFYDNNATPYIVENGQYSWRTRFTQLASKWRLPYGMQLSGQILFGDTLMQNSEKGDMVRNNFSSAYVKLSKRWSIHRLTGRLEKFSVTDNDQTIGDNNNEKGTAITVNYSYRLAKPTFLSVEYNQIISHRAARSYLNQPQHLTEKQWQLSIRHFF